MATTQVLMKEAKSEKFFVDLVTKDNGVRVKEAAERKRW